MGESTTWYNFNPNLMGATSVSGALLSTRQIDEMYFAEEEDGDGWNLKAVEHATCQAWHAPNMTEV